LIIYFNISVTTEADVVASWQHFSCLSLAEVDKSGCFCKGHCSDEETWDARVIVERDSRTKFNHLYFCLITHVIFFKEFF